MNLSIWSMSMNFFRTSVSRGWRKRSVGVLILVEVFRKNSV